MIVIDTNIVSVLMDSEHQDFSRIESWRRATADQNIRVTSISKAEVNFGIAILPEGAKKRRLTVLAHQFFTPLMNLILPFGFREAEAYGSIMASRRAQGHPMGSLDAQIAAIAKVAGAIVATRDVSDFLDCGVPVVNPYQQA